MRTIYFAVLLFASTGAAKAGDLNIRLMVAGEVAPGVYGQVQLGAEPPPRLVYAQPVMIQPPEAPEAPVYLHVPPGHAKNWRKHCREYNACDRPVYFVRSEEYEPGYDRRDYDQRRMEGADRERARQLAYARDREIEQQRSYEREHDRRDGEGDRGNHGRDHEHDDRRDGEGDHHRQDEH